MPNPPKPDPATKAEELDRNRFRTRVEQVQTAFGADSATYDPKLGEGAPLTFTAGGTAIFKGTLPEAEKHLAEQGANFTVAPTGGVSVEDMNVP